LDIKPILISGRDRFDRKLFFDAFLAWRSVQNISISEPVSSDADIVSRFNIQVFIQEISLH
jgi:hypothetical protein